ncbi:MAG: DUF6794 domain-containing protein [Ruthenibacterium sp.]
MEEFDTEIKKSFSEIEKLFDTTELSCFMNCNYSELHRYHFSLGIWIRNHLLGDGSNLYELLLQGGLVQKMRCQGLS